MGDIVFLTFPNIGDEFSKGNPIVEIEATKTVAEAYAPMDCKITEVNNQLDTEPEIVNTDPTGSGWLVKAEITNKTKAIKYISKYTETIKIIGPVKTLE